jgi:hypothetical protein
VSYSQAGQLPAHQYCFVDASFISRGTGWIPCVWFGLVSIPGRAWGCTVMLECGAVYRAIPPHALAFNEIAEPIWPITRAQRWDCYGREFSTIEYTYLRGLNVEANVRGKILNGEYLFTAAPIDDGFSRKPEQAKEFSFIKLDNWRLTIQPTDKLLFHETSFAEPKWPTDLVSISEVYSCEDLEP